MGRVPNFLVNLLLNLIMSDLLSEVLIRTNPTTIFDYEEEVSWNRASIAGPDPNKVLLNLSDKSIYHYCPSIPSVRLRIMWAF